jgi:hypothetical protein
MISMAKKRRVFEQGHRRKFLVILDESPEVESALFFAASRIGHTGGQIVMLYVIEPTDFTQWAGVKDMQILKLIDEDEDIAIMILGAAVDSKGPGPLVSSLAAGKLAGSFPIPIVIVPGNLTVEDLKAMA